MEGACPTCLLEVFDDEHCPLCDGQRQFQSAAEFEAALRAWAIREQGHVADARALQEFLGATLVQTDVHALYAQYTRRIMIERLCDPFDRAQGGAATVAPRSERAPATDRVPLVPLVTLDYAVSQAGAAPAPVSFHVNGDPQPQAPSRALLYPLASVAASDGVMELDERWFLDECLKRYGVAPSTDAEIRIYHPLDYAALVPVEMRETVLDDMCRLAMIDGLPDAAEARMIYAYCSEWRIPEERAREKLIEMQNENISLARRFWLGFRNYVLPGRWENTKL
jgi:hypothetical protein